MWRKTKNPANRPRTIPQLEVLETRYLLSGSTCSINPNPFAQTSVDADAENLAFQKFGVDLVLIADAYVLATNAQFTPQGSAFLAASVPYLQLADTILNSASLPPAVQTFKTQIEQEQWGPAASTAVQAVAASPLTPLGMNLMADALVANLAENQSELDSWTAPASDSVVDNAFGC